MEIILNIYLTESGPIRRDYEQRKAIGIKIDAGERYMKMSKGS